MAQTELQIAGMTCESCPTHVREALERAGAQEVEVDWHHGRATLARNGVGERELSRALEGTRYRVVDITDRGREEDEQSRGTRDYDLIVIGSGGAAMAAGIRARDLGRRVLLVEHGPTGGTCVNIGCIPSKSLLADSERVDGHGPAQLPRAVERKAGLVAQLRQDKYVDLIDDYGIEFRGTHAELLDSHTVAVDGEPTTADAILVAAGARPGIPPIPGLEEAGYLTSTTALEVTDPPPRLAVIGANAVGLELGQMLGNFGSKVTFLARRGVAPYEEREIGEGLTEVLEADGHTVLAPADTHRVERVGEEKVVRGEVAGEPFELRVDEILVATGRQPNTDGLGLEGIGVEVDPLGAIGVDQHQRTSVPSVYAAGDVTTQPQYVYVAAAGGSAAAGNALGDGDERLDFDSLPRIIFTRPTIAAAGLTEGQARARGLEVETTLLPLDAVPRALVNGETRGVFKLVAEAETGRLVGASILADGAGDVILSAVLAIDRGMTVEELAATWAPYLTMAEGLKLAAQSFGREVGKLSCCAA